MKLVEGFRVKIKWLLGEMIHPVYHGVVWETINAGLVGLIFCKPFVFGNSCPQLWGCIGNIGVRNLVSVIL